MHITRIELENIKSHAEFACDFQRGTTAITGENGAGKTTLIEAVAWTLFDLLDYKKDDFVRRGAKRGIARVTFESGLDERLYTVVRDTGTAYYVVDVSLKERIADKKEEVARFLWAHLGVEPGTDLEALFRRAIGVPQGTFTAIFLETPTERKKAFDKLLKVEEYRQGAEKLLQTSRFVEQKINDTKIRIGRAEGELARYEIEQESLKSLKKQTKELTKALAAIDAEVNAKAEIVKTMDATAGTVADLKAEFEKLQTEKTRIEFLVESKNRELEQARAATEKLKTVERDHQAHLAALGKLQVLERARNEREKLVEELRAGESAEINLRAEKKRFEEGVQKVTHARTEIEKLRPQAVEQTAFEKLKDDLIAKLSAMEAKKAEIARLDEKRQLLRAKYIDNKKQIKDFETLAEAAKDVGVLQKRETEITHQITRYRAKLEIDEQFQSEVRNGLCPILSQKCLNLKEGETLESFLKNQFVEVRTQIGALEEEQKSVTAALKAARDAEKYSAALVNLRARAEEIAEEGTGYTREQQTLEAETLNQEKLAHDLELAQRTLQNLGNPKAKIELLDKEAKATEEMRDKLVATNRELAALETSRKALSDKLAAYKDLDKNWSMFTSDRDRTAAAHREFVANEIAAKALGEREKEADEAAVSLKTAEEKLAGAASKLTDAQKDYDSELHQREKFELAGLEKRQTETRVHLENAEKQKAQTEEELKRLSEIRKSMQNEFLEKQRLETVLEATDFIRETLKKSAPLVAKNYIYYVSLEANQMFREISGNAERTLKWTEDYGIALEEDGYERPFVSLSGGEQMAAALSIRLALLKQMSDIRIAFFDEPTTNMDGVRRERLAEQISQITDRQTFDQLFVISHDDTFEGYVDHVISVGHGDSQIDKP